LELGDAELLLLVHDEIGDSWPSLMRGWVKITRAQFSEQLGVSMRSVSDRIDRLVGSGHLQRKKRSEVDEPIAKRTSGRGHVYRAAFPWKEDPQLVRRRKRERIQRSVRRRLQETQIQANGEGEGEDRSGSSASESASEEPKQSEQKTGSISAEHLDGLSDDAAETAKDLYRQYAPGR